LNESSIKISEVYSSFQIDDSSKEKPIKLIIYKPENRKDIIVLNHHIKTYFEELIKPQAGLDGIVEIKKGFSNLEEFVNININSENNIPMILLCSQALHIIPWELLITERYLIRSFSLQKLINNLNKIKKKKKKEIEKEKLEMKIFNFTLYLNKDEKISDESRLVWIRNILFHQLKEGRKPSFSSSYSVKYPFNTPLIGKKFNKVDTIKKRLKYIRIFDLSTINHSHEIVKSLTPKDNIFIFSYTDLLEMSESLMYLLRLHNEPTMIFIPSNHLKKVVRNICNTQLKYERGKIQRESLLETIKLTEKEFKIPICVFNPI